MIREIIKFPDPLLSRTSSRIANIDDGIRQLASDMVETMVAASGVGISAIQVGILSRIMIVMVTKSSTSAKEPEVMINPKILSKDGFQRQTEGCLSFPGVSLPVNRYESVEIEYQDLTGEQRHAILYGIESVCFQHELDHLDGIVFVNKDQVKTFGGLR